MALALASKVQALALALRDEALALIGLEILALTTSLHHTRHHHHHHHRKLWTLANVFMSASRSLIHTRTFYVIFSLTFEQL